MLTVLYYGRRAKEDATTPEGARSIDPRTGANQTSGLQKVTKQSTQKKADKAAAAKSPRPSPLDAISRRDSVDRLVAGPPGTPGDVVVAESTPKFDPGPVVMETGGFTSAAIDALQRLVLTLDQDGNGAFSVRELTLLWRLCFPQQEMTPVVQDAVQQLFANMDTDKNGCVEVDEFLSYIEEGMVETRRVTLTKPKSRREWVWCIVGNDDLDFLAKESRTLNLIITTMKFVLQLVIIISMIILAVESTAPYQTRDDSSADGTGPSGDEQTHAAEAACMTIFTFEYFMYIVSYPRGYKMLTEQDWWIHLLSILPFWLELATGSILGKVAVIRVLRLMRLFRILRLTRMTGSQQSRRFARVPSFARALKYARGPLWVFLIMFFILVSVSGCLVTFFERLESTFNHTEQLWMHRKNGAPLLIQSIPDGVYWAIVTSTTTGYGDVFPYTHGGRFVAVTTMLSTIIVLAFPINILSSVFTVIQEEEDEEHSRRCQCSSFYDALLGLVETTMHGQRVCKGCDNVLLGDALFCRRCGMQTGQKPPTCENCKNPFSDDAHFCRKCGKPRGYKRRKGDNGPEGWFTEAQRMQRTEQFIEGMATRPQALKTGADNDFGRPSAPVGVVDPMLSRSAAALSLALTPTSDPPALPNFSQPRSEPPACPQLELPTTPAQPTDAQSVPSPEVPDTGASAAAHPGRAAVEAGGAADGGAVADAPRPRKRVRKRSSGVPPPGDEEPGSDGNAADLAPVALLLRKQAAAIGALHADLRELRSDVAHLRDASDTAGRKLERIEAKLAKGGAPQTCECGNIMPDDGAQFCRKCGRSRGPATCDGCGNVYADDALFCRMCGKARPDSQKPHVEKPSLLPRSQSFAKLGARGTPPRP